MLAEEWDWERNTGEPALSSVAPQHRVAWRCAVCGHAWVASVSERLAEDGGCPECARIARSFQVRRRSRSLTEVAPETAMEWHPTFNGWLRPSDVSADSARRVWWLCRRDHEWKERVRDRTHAGRGCPVCARPWSAPTIPGALPGR
ncbi:zinc-ribbon domain-containing protein [Ornithinicoccus hortensis]|uniref:Putative zinc ribbon protein n=1 Tax=Ornithinicoccus hortensis TaxID=82346 RepID=A0A542YLP1_9MICO|nr:zinc-ribbon domain-containing protein [Ornithinicoccus hortensis]TQL49009.1 putative zinc ribbon protein [Ornithinicoccus hortensis]